MSEIKANKIQAGISLTPANNFVLDASADNGTVVLKRANGTEVLSVDASGNLLGKSSNPVDQTPSRLIQFGDFGVGYGIPRSGVSLDTLTIPGVYTVDATCTNRPSEAHPEVTLPLHVHSNNDRVIQMAYQGHSEIVSWIRTYNTVSWGSWRRVFNQGSILGTVSQSAGVPTGAIIERGSNANGEYVKFADGTLFCSGYITEDLVISTAFLGGFRSSGRSWTFPATFSQDIRVMAIPYQTSAFSAIVSGNSATVCTYLFTSVTTQASASRSVQFLAIGRWF